MRFCNLYAYITCNQASNRLLIFSVEKRIYSHSLFYYFFSLFLSLSFSLTLSIRIISIRKLCGCEMPVATKSYYRFSVTKRIHSENLLSNWFYFHHKHSCLLLVVLLLLLLRENSNKSQNEYLYFFFLIKFRIRISVWIFIIQANKMRWHFFLFTCLFCYLYFIPATLWPINCDRN